MTTNITGKEKSRRMRWTDKKLQSLMLALATLMKDVIPWEKVALHMGPGISKTDIEQHIQMLLRSSEPPWLQDGNVPLPKNSNPKSNIQEPGDDLVKVETSHIRRRSGVPPRYTPAQKKIHSNSAEPRPVVKEPRVAKERLLSDTLIQPQGVSATMNNQMRTSAQGQPSRPSPRPITGAPQAEETKVVNPAPQDVPGADHSNLHDRVHKAAQIQGARSRVAAFAPSMSTVASAPVVAAQTSTLRPTPMFSRMGPPTAVPILLPTTDEIHSHSIPQDPYGIAPAAFFSSNPLYGQPPPPIFPSDPYSPNLTNGARGIAWNHEASWANTGLGTAAAGTSFVLPSQPVYGPTVHSTYGGYADNPGPYTRVLVALRRPPGSGFDGIGHQAGMAAGPGWPYGANYGV